MFEVKMSPVWACAAVLALAVTACGDDGAGTGGGSTSGDGGSSSDGGGSGDGGNASNPSSSGSNNPTTTSGNPQQGSNSASSGGDGGAGPGPGNGGAGPGAGGSDGGSGPGAGGGDEGGGPVFIDVCPEVNTFWVDPVCDICTQANCCDQAAACNADLENCVDEEGAVDPESTLGGPLDECIAESCNAECSWDFSTCDTGLIIPPNEPASFCLDQNCCTEFVACYGADGEDLDACNDCLNENGGDLCDGLIECSDSEGCNDIESPYAICDSGVILFDSTAGEGNYDGAQCLTFACCEEWNDCTNNAASDDDVEACFDCLDAGGGDLCDDVLSCSLTECDLNFGPPQ